MPSARRSRVIVSLALIAVASMDAADFAPYGAIDNRQASSPPCVGSEEPAASSALNCMTLVPVPDFPAAHGTIQLQPIPNPFGVAVRSDGRPRYRLIGTFDGLTPPRSLGEYATYLAWAYTLSLDTVI